MSIALDRSTWPVAVVTPTDGDALAGDVLAPLLADDARYGLVIDGGAQPREVSEAVHTWLAEHEASVRAHVVAIATVVAAATVENSRRFIAEHPDMYPCPVWVAATRAECTTWVTDELEERA